MECPNLVLAFGVQSRGSSKSPSKTTTRIILDGRQRRPYNGEHAAGEETNTPRRRNGSTAGQWGGLANRIGLIPKRRGTTRDEEHCYN